MSFKQISTLAFAVAGFVSLSSPVWADDMDKPMFSLAGYGTLGVVHSSEDQADFVSNLLQPKGAGRSENWSAGIDSRLGLQVTANVNAQWSAVLQVISQENYQDSYRPSVEWANVKYQATPDLSVRVGRIALPTFLTADYRNVGYAIPWVRTPSELYNLIPITNSDGLDVRYRMHFGEVTDTVQADIGTGHIRAPGGSDVDVSAMHGLTNTIEYGAATVRMTYLRANLDLDLGDPLFAAFSQFGPQGMAIANRYSGENKLITYAGIGASYDPGEWFVMAELGNTNAHSFLGEKTAGYVTGGWRLGKFTPYATYAQSSANSNRSDPGISTAGLPPQLAGEAMELNAGLNELLGSIAVQKSVSLGLRWDFMKNAALKTQLDFIRTGQGSPGYFTNAQPGFMGSHANVASVALDFVF